MPAASLFVAALDIGVQATPLPLILTVGFVALGAWLFAGDRSARLAPYLLALIAAVALAGYGVYQEAQAGRSPCAGSASLYVGLRMLLYLILAALPFALRQALTGKLPSPQLRRAVRGEDLASIALLITSALVVRFVLAQPELIADPGTVQGRVGGPNALFDGLRPYLRLFLPQGHERRIWSLTYALAATSALGPAALFAGGRALGLETRAALLGALAFLCWPIPTVLFNSDYLQGAVLTFTWFGYALVAAGSARRSPKALAAGMLLMGFVVWSRIETLLVTGPALLIGARAALRHRRSPVVVAAFTTATVSVVARLVVLTTCSDAGSAGTIGAARLAQLFGRFASSGEQALPILVLLGLICFTALSVIRRRHGLVWAGLLIGLIPASANSGGVFELPRYAALALPWVGLAAGLGLIGLADLLTDLARRARGAPLPWLRPLLTGLLLIWPLASIWSQRAYLGQRYTTSVTDQAFREALDHVPARCGVIIPSIDNDEVQMDIRPRTTYTSILEAEQPKEPSLRPWAGSSDLAPDLRRGRWAPAVHAHYGWWRGPPPPVPCWTFFWGWTCEAEEQLGETGYHHRHSGCDVLRERLELEPIWRRRASLRSHRLFSRPEVEHGPLVRPDFEFVLYEVRGLAR
jgi:hypothetical protein